MSRWGSQEWTADVLVGGHPALDFVNTAGGSTKRRDRERLTDYAAVLRWGRVAGVLDDDEAAALHDAARRNADAAAAALDALRRFREDLHRVLMAEQARADWPEAERRSVEDAIRRAIAVARLERADDRRRWRVAFAAAGLALPMARLGLAANELLTGDDLPRLRSCERCSWLFLDRGRGRPRRWCSMAACGNREKAARHYRRTRAG